jgi:mono/diheme cytochrome c family protein
MARTAILLAGMLAVASMGLVAVRAQGPTTNDGIYTAAQAAKGKALFGQACESCHNPGKFAGAGMSEMPMDNPGSLKREDVASLIAYFLEMNKYPAGQKALSGEADALKAIMVAPRP